MTAADVAGRIAAQLGATPTRLQPLSGGCVSEVLLAQFEDGRRVVAKVGDPGGGLDLEARMLEALRDAHWPVPGVLYAGRDLLLMDYVDSDGNRDGDAEERAAELLVHCHGLPQPAFGFDYDTVIAGLPQANPRSAQWLPFFTEQRLLAMAGLARAAGRLPDRLHARIETLAGRLDRWLIEPSAPSLIHGDLWGGNILFHRGAPAACIDPACYWADAEIELAFTTLFHTFGDAFFQRYRELRPIADGFFEERRDLYNLYPLLVHVRLFGGSYVASVEATLRRYGV